MSEKKKSPHQAISLKEKLASDSQEKKGLIKQLIKDKKSLKNGILLQEILKQKLDLF